MKNLASYLLVMFMVMFWVFRIVTAVTYTFGLDFIVEPLNMNFEVVLLFVAFLSVLLVAKRKMIGAIIYLAGYGAYFGMDIYNKVMLIIGEGATLNDYTQTLFSFVGIILAVAVLFELLLDKNRKAHPVDKKTDWFYKGKQYDRKMDERADKNNYRIL